MPDIEVVGTIFNVFFITWCGQDSNTTPSQQQAGMLLVGLHRRLMKWWKKKILLSSLYKYKIKWIWVGNLCITNRERYSNHKQNFIAFSSEKEQCRFIFLHFWHPNTWPSKSTIQMSLSNSHSLFISCSVHCCLHLHLIAHKCFATYGE